ncbi:MAG: FtsX-like permease family protein [Saprospiraceae bacterium]|nr:FtsX-like permease family protein [Saprospiraceae bacterium]
MNLPLKFARRYLFSKKSTNAINIISGISVFGICIGSMALIVIMSVFNGFEGLLGELIGNFKPDVKITASSGKVFIPDNKQLVQIKDLEGVKEISKTVEEIALLEYDGAQNIGFIKGVDDNYSKVTALDTCLLSGKYITYDSINKVNYAIVGATLEHTLGVLVGQAFNQKLTVYMPKRTKKNLSIGLTKKPFKKRNIYPAAIYQIQQPEYDNYVITNLKFVQELTSYSKGEISALEIKLNANINSIKTIDKIKKILGKDYIVQNRYQQDEALYKITNLEKYVAFLIFAFTLILVAFNMVGALWMLVLDKKKDISTLKSMGATNDIIRQIFIAEGFLLSAFGLFLGCLLAISLCFLQQQFGLVKLTGSGNFIIDAYPVEMRFTDFIQVIITVLLIGTCAAWIPAQRACKITNIVRIE